MAPMPASLVAPLVRPLVVRGLLLKERVRTGATFNPLDPRYQQDPVPCYARLRERDAVHRSELARGWVLSRFSDVDAVLRDYRRFANDGRKASAAPMEQAMLRLEAPSILFVDPPDHTRLRALVARPFARSAIEAWRGRIEHTVDGLLDAIGDAPEFDLMERFAEPLPTLVIAEMLGIPSADYPRFRAWSAAVARTLEPTIAPQELEDAIAARDALRAYLDPIVEERRRAPREDLVSVLVVAEAGGDALTHEELITMLVLLLVAGNETTTNLIGNGTLALLSHPDQLAWLRAHPDRVAEAVEELLRFDGPVQADGRTALEDVEIAGKRVRRGEQVLLLLGAANRDPRRFVDPDRLDLARGDRNHVGFGRGIHHCLGAPLARLEAQIAFARLLERFPDLRVVDRRPRFKDHVVLRGLERLRVATR